MPRSFDATIHTKAPFAFHAIIARVEEICFKQDCGEPLTHDEMMLKQMMGFYRREKAIAEKRCV